MIIQKRLEGSVIHLDHSLLNSCSDKTLGLMSFHVSMIRWCISIGWWLHEFAFIIYKGWLNCGWIRTRSKRIELYNMGWTLEVIWAKCLSPKRHHKSTHELLLELMNQIPTWSVIKANKNKGRNYGIGTWTNVLWPTN
jgi:hypothetical protein